MFHLGTPLWVIAVRSAVVYVALFVALRVMGKRELGQMTVFDLVVILLIANAVQNAMVGADVSLEGGILAALVLLGVNRLVVLLHMQRGIWGRLIEGTPTVLVEDGQVIASHLKREGLGKEEIEMAIREHGVATLDEVRLAVLEVDGSISVVPMSSPVVKTHRHVRQLRKH